MRGAAGSSVRLVSRPPRFPTIATFPRTSGSLTVCRRNFFTNSGRTLSTRSSTITSSTVGEAESRIISPNGAIVAEAKDKFAHAIAEIDLNQEWRLRYLSVGNGTGEAKSLYLRERRPETYAPLLSDSEPEPVRRPRT